MNINLIKPLQDANLQNGLLKTAVQSAFAATPKFNTGMPEKDTVCIKKAAKALFPNTDKTTQVPQHHDINGINGQVRYVLDMVEQGRPIKKYDEYIFDLIKELDNEFKKLPPLEDDFVFYRGRGRHGIVKRFDKDFDIIEAAKAGDTIVPDKGYSYGAFKKELAECWARSVNDNMMMEIHVPKGAKVSRNLEHGGEVVFPRGAQYKLISKEKDKNGILNVVLEYILPE